MSGSTTRRQRFARVALALLLVGGFVVLVVVALETALAVVAGLAIAVILTILVTWAIEG